MNGLVIQRIVKLILFLSVCLLSFLSSLSPSWKRMILSVIYLCLSFEDLVITVITAYKMPVILYLLFSSQSLPSFLQPPTKKVTL